MNLIYDKEDKLKMLEKSLKCYLKSCGTDYKNFVYNRRVHYTEFPEIVYLYTNNVLSKKEFIDKMNTLDKEHFNSNYYIKFATCVITNCYECCKTFLDYYISEIPIKAYKKPSTYTVDDFIKIMKLYYFHNRTMKIIKSKALNNIIKMDDIVNNH
jgi:hypothetical protein